jgi:hypothetical protein
VRADAKAHVALDALAKAVEAKFDRAAWLELGLITDTEARITGHRRLLRSLEWGDEDYAANVREVLRVVLGQPPAPRLPATRGLLGLPPAAPPARSQGPPRPAAQRFLNLHEVEEFVGLQAWLAEHDQALHDELYGGEDPAVLDDLQAAAKQLGLSDVDAHAARIRRGLRDDPAQAVGSSKELLETVLKAVLGLHGSGPETKRDIPQLIKQANVKLGLDAAGVRGDDPGAVHRRKLLGSLSTIVNTTGELRNAGLGTGHGLSVGPTLDVASARLVAAAATAVATFYIEAYAIHHEAPEA